MTPYVKTNQSFSKMHQGIICVFNNGHAFFFVCHNVTALQPRDEIVPLGCRAVVPRQPQS